jgi:hypothetical protein
LGKRRRFLDGCRDKNNNQLPLTPISDRLPITLEPASSTSSLLLSSMWGKFKTDLKRNFEPSPGHSFSSVPDFLEDMPISRIGKVYFVTLQI